MSDMSPRSTFQSWGSSSMEVERTSRPTRVRRRASGSRLPSASRSSVMVLNLRMRNIRPLRPGRSCRKNAPAPRLAKCSHTVTTPNGTAKTMSDTPETSISIRRLKKCLYNFSIFCLVNLKGVPTRIQCSVFQ